jgi:glycosyltransferase involved in cell wall biosynthesis
MKVSIITVVYNNVETIRTAIDSVLSQDYPEIEHIIIDGQSNDGTNEVIQSYGNRVAKSISEADKGIYDAMNKGLALATGEVIGILNSDDFYATNTSVSEIVKELQDKKTDIAFADLVFVSPQSLDKVLRYYSSADFYPEKFAWGWMPGHPTCFIRKKVYDRYGDFKTDYKIAADYEILTRFIAKYKVSYSYLPKVIVKMRIGGVSNRNLKNVWILNKEIVRGCSENGIKTNMAKVLLKYFKKIFQFINIS